MRVSHKDRARSLFNMRLQQRRLGPVDAGPITMDRELGDLESIALIRRADELSALP